ncbi:helix-turn-helix domain-containing protein [Xiamenia xianingshaonis]|uniref:helix-turn-helix domain-containing protein n=1 Tax=Xiamenia xianingshaonis TaxID=2682776 RepID=UPI0021BD251F|nr:helix-turn-helix domain-containing protein [Xiamenia xianingshaonis]
MSGRPLYDIAVRRRAIELYEEGWGRDTISRLVGAPEGTVRKWLDTYRSVGMGALAAMGAKKTTYSFETKVAAVKAVADEGMTVPRPWPGSGSPRPALCKNG